MKYGTLITKSFVCILSTLLGWATLVIAEPFDVEVENFEAKEFIQNNLPELNKLEFPVIVVPGFSSLVGTKPIPIHATAKRRLKHAVAYFEKHGGIFLVSGGNVHPKNTPYNEAYEMKKYLLNNYKISNARVVIDPYARHSTTNLRNAGRFILSNGLNRAIVITSSDQSFYFSFPKISGFHNRCRKELGYEVGDLKRMGLNHTSFVPYTDVFRVGSDNLDP